MSVADVKHAPTPSTDEQILDDLREEVSAFSASMVAEDRRANKAEADRDSLAVVLEALIHVVTNDVGILRTHAVVLAARAALKAAKVKP